ncbi:glutamine amidotransferase [Gaopeijia maritima]|uniref:glutamine amidotransferase n=1 Tax=Gaopeijia maritima TaxID=3119007 RepID=UPI00324C96F5
MNDRILYAGDSHLGGAAAYLAGVLSHGGIPFDHVPSDAPLGPTLGLTEPRLYVISDYPVKNLTDADMQRISGDVAAGAGLLMIGGWESFHGAAGEYHTSPLAEILPVRMQNSDDRVNAARPCLVEKGASHPILEGLPLERPPGIGGYNRVEPREGAEVLLFARHCPVEVDPRGQYTVTPGARAPLLVVGHHGRGRTAAFASDVAPHWVGGLVDWGEGRVKACAPGGVEIEVGSLYAEFFTRLVRWTMGA